MSEWYVLEVFFIDIHFFAPPAAPASAAGLSTSAAGRSCVVSVAPPAEELHIISDHVDGAPLGAVLGFPGTVLHAAFDEYGVPLLGIVRDTLAELSPRGNVEEVYFIVLGEHPIYRQSEPAHRRAALREP